MSIQDIDKKLREAEHQIKRELLKIAALHHWRGLECQVTISTHTVTVVPPGAGSRFHSSDDDPRPRKSPGQPIIEVTIIASM